MLVDLDLLEHESAYHALFLAAAGGARPARGHLAPRATGRRGIKTALIHAKLGQPAERWFSQTRPRDAALKHAALRDGTRLDARACGARVPTPEHTPARTPRVAAWLAEKRAAGRRPFS